MKSTKKPAKRQKKQKQDETCLPGILSDCQALRQEIRGLRRKTPDDPDPIRGCLSMYLLSGMQIATNLCIMIAKHRMHGKPNPTGSFLKLLDRSMKMAQSGWKESRI